MSDVPVIKIAVDTEDFDAFADKFNAYREHLKANPEAWAKVNQEIKGAKSAFESAGQAFDKIQKGAENPKVPRVFDQLTKNAKESEKSWGKISKEIEKSSRFMQTLVRGSINFSAFGGAVGAIGALGATAFGATLSAANSVAAQNASSRGLGLELGKESAFNTFFKRFGLGSADLETMENAKSDVTKQTPLFAAGLTTKQINDEDAEELQFDFAKRVGKQYSEWEKINPTFALTQASAYGYDQIYSPDQMRNLASYSASGELDKAQEQYRAHWKEMGVSQSRADEASAFDTNQAAIWKRVETAWDSAVLKLAPALDKWSLAAANLTSKFLNASGDVLQHLEGPPHVPGTPYDKGPVGATEKVEDWLTKNVLAGWYKNHPQYDPSGGGVGTGANDGGTANSTGSSAFNIGNMRVQNSKDFQKFDSLQAGAQGMAAQLKLYQDKYGLNTVDQIVNRWAPAADGNDDASYIKDVSARTGFGANQKLDLSDPTTLTALESAMATHEKGSRFSDLLTPTKIAEYLKGGQQQDKQQASTKFNKIDGFDVEPYPDEPPAPSHLSVEMTALANRFKSMFREGGGTQFFGPRMNNDQDTPATPNRTALPQQTIGVSVFAAPGASVDVIGASLAN